MGTRTDNPTTAVQRQARPGALSEMAWDFGQWVGHNHRMLGAAMGARTPEDSKVRVASLVADFTAVLMEDGKLVEAAQKHPTFMSRALLLCARTGLRPGRTTKHMALIAYGSVPELQLEYRGYIHLAMRSGHVRKIQAGVVTRAEYDAGLFETDGREFATLKFDLDKREEGQRLVEEAVASKKTDCLDHIALAFCEVEMVNGVRHVFLLTSNELRKRRASSKGYTAYISSNRQSPWNDHAVAMCRKSVIRAAMDSGLLLLSDDAANALRAEGTDMAQFEVREEAQAIESGVGPIVFPPESVDVSPAHPPQADARRSPRPFVPPPDPVADVEGDGAPYADEGYSG